MTTQKPHRGRKPGVPNRATTEAREAIALFVQKNMDRLQTWLDKIAERDPKQAYDCFMAVIEYHVPKLQRTEVDSNIKNNISIEIKRFYEDQHPGEQLETSYISEKSLESV